MLPKKSTVDPDGPLASAIATLENLGCQPEVAEIRRLLAEWLHNREEASRTRDEMARTRAEAASANQNVQEAQLVAREHLGRWRNLALILQNREELARCEEALRKYPWLRVTAACFGYAAVCV